METRPMHKTNTTGQLRSLSARTSTNQQTRRQERRLARRTVAEYAAETANFSLGTARAMHAFLHLAWWRRWLWVLFGILPNRKPVPAVRQQNIVQVTKVEN